MIPLHQQVTSLELSKRLKELGVKQEGAFYWQFPKPMESLPFNKRPFEERHDWFLTNSGNLDWCKEDIRCAAFTVAELGKILPIGIYSGRGANGRYFCDTDREDMGINVRNRLEFYEDTEADARAKMLIHLIEKGLLDAKKI